MTEILLTLLIVITLGVHVWYVKKYFEQEKTLMKALMSRDINEFVGSVLAEKPARKEKEKPSDLVNMQEVDDDQFFKAIHKSI